MDGIQAYLSPHASDLGSGRQMRRQEERKCSSANTSGSMNRTERGPSTLNHGTQEAGRGLVEHGRRSPTAGRGEKSPRTGYLRCQTGSVEDGRRGEGHRAGPPKARWGNQQWAMAIMGIRTLTP